MRFSAAEWRCCYGLAVVFCVDALVSHNAALWFRYTEAIVAGFLLMWSARRGWPDA